MIDVLGTSLAVFVFVTVVLAGGASYMAGQALASHWRPVWQVFVYGALLGFADRFITFALFGGQLGLLSGYIIDTVVIVAIGLLSYRLTRARQMVAQYPWLYRRQGLLSWREISEHSN